MYATRECDHQPPVSIDVRVIPARSGLAVLAWREVQPDRQTWTRADSR